MRILVHGHLGMGNLGDELMLAPILTTLAERFPEAKLIVAAGPSVPGAIRNNSKVSIVPRSPMRLCVEIVRARLFVVAGGTHLASFRGATRHLRGIVRQLLMVLLARATFSKVVMLSVGFGPFEEKWGERFANLLLFLTNYVSVRDDASVSWLDAIGRSPKRYNRCHDAALYTARATPNRLRPRLGISMMPFFANYGGQTEKDLVLVDQFIPVINTWLHCYPDSSVCLISFLKQDSMFSDERVLGALKAKFALEDRVELLDEPPDIDLAKQQFSSFTHFISMRYHSQVMAWLNEIPQLCVTYHRKNRLFAAEHGISDQVCFSVEDVIQGRLGDASDRFFRMPKEFLTTMGPLCMPTKREDLLPRHVEF